MVKTTPLKMTERTPHHIKLEAAQEARAICRRLYPDVPEEGACVPLALSLGTVMQRRGIPALVQAGSASWSCGEQKPLLDADHFSYVYEPKAAAKALARGILPEMHCWAFLPRTSEFVDLTTGTLPRQFHKLLGGTWREELLPPDFLWLNLDDDCEAEWPGHFSYDADERATVFVLSLAGVTLPH